MIEIEAKSVHRDDLNLLSKVVISEFISNFSGVIMLLFFEGGIIGQRMVFWRSHCTERKVIQP